METAVGIKLHPLDSLRRGADKINTGRSFPDAISLIKELNAENTIMRTEQTNDKLSYLTDPTLEQSKSVICVTNQCTEAPFGKKQKRMIAPLEFLIIINLDTYEPQNKPLIKSVELLTVLTREKTETAIRRILKSEIPENWRFNPFP